ncbi:MAG: hypothetical protein KF858_06750 [Candidatus Sumerlaeia bacterium]|nr:hypothetical protein [Candidatus Sumerlaeia bacterium]
MNPTQATSPRFPLRGYLLINGIVWALLVLVYIAVRQAWFSNVSPAVMRPGVSPVLFLIALAFLVASAFDYIFDRVRLRQFSDPEAASPESDRTGGEPEPPRAP